MAILMNKPGVGSKPRRFWLYRHLFFAVVCFLPTAMGGMSDRPEYQIKAAFLYNFLNFVYWPKAAFNSMNSPIHLCILGKDPFESVMDFTVQGKRIDGRKIIVHRFRNIPEQMHCHMLFISKSENDNMVNILPKYVSQATLTVGDVEGFTDRRGMVQFVMIENRVHFYINREVVNNSPLEMNANLLRLAQPRREEQ